MDEKTQRVRSLLSSYYNLEGEGDSDGAAGTSAEASASPRRSNDPLSLDSSSFDPPRYFAQLLEQTRLDELLDRSLVLQSEVKTFDGDMQMLVYENYNKFISATDTIRSMRTKVDGMEEKMTQVKEKIKRIAEKNAVVDEKMGERRNRFDELNTVRDVMSKLNDVFELPNKCRISMERGALEVAVKYVSTSKPFLEKHGGGGGNEALLQVKAQMDDIQTHLVDLLKERLRTDPDNNVDVINYLRQLGETVTDLEDTFLSSSRVQLEEIVRKATNMFETWGSAASLVKSVQTNQAGEEGGGSSLESLRTEMSAALSILDADFLPSALKLRSQYNTMFVGGSGGAPGASKFDAILNDVLNSAVSAVKAFVLVHPPDSLVEPAPLVAVLGGITAAFGRILAELDQAAPEVGPKLQSSVECSVRNYVGSKFLRLEESLESGVVRELGEVSRAEGSPDILSHLDAVESEAKASFDVFLREMSFLLGPEGGDLVSSWSRAFALLVQEGLFQTLMFTADNLRPMGGSAWGADHFFLSRAARVYADSVVPSAQSALSREPHFGQPAGDEAKRQSAVANAFSALSAFHLDAYVAFMGRKLSQMIRVAMLDQFDWLVYSSQVTQVYPVFVEVSGHLRGIEAMVCQVIAENERKMVNNSAMGSGALHARNPSTSRVERNVDRLFAEKIQIFSQGTKPTQGAILSGIAKIALKSLVECIRLSALNLQAYRLMHASLVFLRRDARSVLGEDDVVEYLMDEAQSAAADRCVDAPTPLEDGDIEEIITK